MNFEDLSPIEKEAYIKAYGQPKSNLGKQLDRHLKMHIVQRDLRIIQTEKKDYNKWMQYMRQELIKRGIIRPL
jgi:hypothetical protein